MRIDALELRAFGPFTNVRLDLTSGAHGLHLIYGDNEAGKSSALRAIHDLLFGIGTQTRDDFRHGYTTLRLGAVLQLADGRRLAFTRRKRNKQPLWDAGDAEPIADDALAPFVGGMDRDEFLRIFGLDHVRLRRASQALQDAGGAAAAVVGSGLGISHLRGVLAALEQEAGNLFKARGRATPVNRLEGELKQKLDEVRKLSVSTRQWRGLVEAVAAAEKAHSDARDYHAGLRSRRDRLRQVQRVREPVAVRRAALRQLPTGTPVVVLATDLGDRRRAVEGRLAGARATLASADKQVKRLQAELDASAAEFGLLASEDEIDRLHALSATTEKAAQDRPRRVAELERKRRERAELAAALEKVAPCDREVLGRGCREAAKLDDVSARRTELAEKSARVRRRSAEGQQRLDRLCGASFTPDELAVQSWPDAATVDSFSDAFARLEDRRRTAADESERLARRIEELAHAIAEKSSGGSLPEEDDLIATRTRRDELWRRVCSAWLERAEVAPELLADYEAEVTAADEIADRLRAESDRVAEVAEFRRQAARAHVELQSAERGITKIGQDQLELTDRWHALWRDLGVQPQTPARMRQAIAERDDLLLQREELAEAEAAAEAFEVRVAATEDMLRRALGPIATGGDFVALREQAEAESTRAQRSAETRARLPSVDEAIGDLEERIGGIDRDAQAFASETAALVARCATDLRELNAHEALRTLGKRLRDQRGARLLRDQFEKQLVVAEADLSEAAKELGKAEAAQQNLCREAGIDDPAYLPAIEECARADRELRREGDIAGLSRLVDEFEVVDLVATLASLEHELKEAQAAEERARDALRDARGLHDAVDGSARAATAAEDAEGLRAELRTQLGSYLRLKLAHGLLATGLERYREANESPVLARASAHLASLTRGRYVRVHADADDKGNPLLRVRPGDQATELELAALSDGTRDQLHLALVLGSLEHRFAHEEPHPLILDDVLVHFDDTRSAAALETLAAFSRRTQVLLFTHHNRIREQAEALGEARGVYVHDLER